MKGKAAASTTAQGSIRESRIRYFTRLYSVMLQKPLILYGLKNIVNDSRTLLITLRTLIITLRALITLKHH